MDYVTPQQARDMGGLRLVVSAGVPGPWGEAAKGMFHARSVAFTPVAQKPLEPNEDLVEWLGIRNAPVAVYEDEPPRERWIDIVMLAERLGSGPPLLPGDSALRALAVGISHELCGEWGFGWCQRLGMLKGMWASAGFEDLSALPEPMAAVQRQYGVYPDRLAAAPARIAAILDMLVARLERQKQAGSPYLVGDSLTCADIHWACFSAMLSPMEQALNPMPDGLRAVYDAHAPAVDEGAKAALLAHRDHIYHNHLRLPVDF